MPLSGHAVAYEIRFCPLESLVFIKIRGAFTLKRLSLRELLDFTDKAKQSTLLITTTCTGRYVSPCNLQVMSVEVVEGDIILNCRETKAGV